jgi:hypothetical protein
MWFEKSNTGDVNIFNARFPVEETQFGDERGDEAYVTNPPTLLVHDTGRAGAVTPSKNSVYGNEAICADAGTAPATSTHQNTRLKMFMGNPPKCVFVYGQ